MNRRGHALCPGPGHGSAPDLRRRPPYPYYPPMTLSLIPDMKICNILIVSIASSSSTVLLSSCSLSQSKRQNKTSDISHGFSFGVPSLCFQLLQSISLTNSSYFCLPFFIWFAPLK